MCLPKVFYPVFMFAFIFSLPLVFTFLGPVVRTPVSANLGLNFNPSFFFLLSKALSRIFFSILFRVSNHQIVFKENLPFKLSYLSSNFALTLGYLNPASNNFALAASISHFLTSAISSSCFFFNEIYLLFLSHLL